MALNGATPGDPVVFLGPTLARDVAQSILRADYQPPARQGDFYRWLCGARRTLVLIDGLFHAQPSVWQREVLAALAEGFRVMGASSMGALRAAETHRFGTIGHGTIFEWYRDGEIDGDDEVALLHGDAESGYRALSEPLVNIRYNLHRATELGLLEPSEQSQLVESMKARPYSDRTRKSLCDCIDRVVAPPKRAEALKHFVAEQGVDLKRQDAISLLRRCAAESSNPLPMPDQPIELERLEREELRHRTVTIRSQAVDGMAALGRAEAMNDPALERELVTRWFLVAWARTAGERCPEDEEKRFLEQWTAERPSSTLDSRLSQAGLARTELRRLLAERALAQWLRRQGESRFKVSAGAVDDAYISDWAARHGIKPEKGVAGLVARGPKSLGFRWDRGLELLRELQLTGRLDELA